MNNPNHFPSLSFDGCGINGRDEYRSRIATFADKRGPIAKEYGPLFAAAPKLLAAVEHVLIASEDNGDMNDIDWPMLRSALAEAKGK